MGDEFDEIEKSLNSKKIVRKSNIEIEDLKEKTFYKGMFNKEIESNSDETNPFDQLKLKEKIKKRNLYTDSF